MLEIIPGEIPTKELHQHLLSSVSPRPIAFASTISKEGNINLSPFSFFNVFSANPPTLIFSPARRVRDNTTKHTLENIYEVPEVVINVVSYSIVEQMNLSSTEYDEEVNEFIKAGLTAVDSDKIRPPRVKESPVQMECKVVEIKPLADTKGAGNLIICEVLKMHIDEQVLDDSGKIDAHKIDLVGRMGGPLYSRASGDAVFSVEKPIATRGIGIDMLPDSIRNSKVLTGNDLGKLGNLEKLPSSQDLEEFRNSDLGKSALDECSNEEERHKKASEWLKDNRKFPALALLMA